MNRLLQNKIVKFGTNALKTLLLLCAVLLCLQADAGNGGGRKKEGPKKQAGKKASLVNFNEAYFNEKSQFNNPEIDRLRGQANTAINEVDAQQRYIDFLSPSDLNRLPLGLKKKVGNTTVKIAISSAVFASRYAELTVFAKIEIPQNNNSNVGAGAGNPNAANNKKTLFFGVKGLKLSKDGGIIGDAKIILMGDYAIPMNGGKSSLILKGGFDINTGQGIDKTYITLDCNGFKELGVAADVELPRSLFVPTDAQGNVQSTGVVKGSFSTVVSNWNDILASVSLTPFEMKGLDGVGFKIDNAVVDLSDYRNSPDIVYPQGYQQKYLGNDETTLPLWRGFYAKEIRVTLPKSFGNRDSAGRVSFGAQNMIIDNNGLTGLFYAENIIPLHKGKAGGWQFSVDSFRIALEANRLLRAGFGGKIGLPVNKRQDVAESSNPDEVKKRFLAYSAVFATSGEYICRVINKDTLNFDIWKARVRLTPNSYIELAGNKETFRPSAMLNGDIELKSNTGTGGNERANSIIDFKGISFQQLYIRTTAPYISAQYFGVNGSVNLKLGMASLTLDSIRLKSYGSDEMGLAFAASIVLQNDAFKGKSNLAVIGKYSEEAGLASWKYNRIKIEDIEIHAQVGVLKLDGYAQFMDNDPIYGDGFRGKLDIKISAPKIEAAITTVFGNKGFRYWFVDGRLNLPGAEGNAVNISGVCGGAYYQMKKGDVINRPVEEQLSPFNYVPDSTAGLGIRLGVLFNIFTSKVDEGMAMLEVAFNKHGGMRYIGLFGNLKVMAKIDLTDKLGEVTKQFEKVEDKIKSYTPAVLESKAVQKMLAPTAAAGDMFQGVDVSNISGSVTASIGISYDFNNKVFDANADVYINFGSIFTGRGPGGRAGWLKVHVGPNKWFIHMGSPSDPLGVRVGLGPISLQTYAYFMVGHDIPAFPDIPPALQSMFASTQNVSYENPLSPSKVSADVNTGKGFAFGAGAEFRTGDIKFLILYANFSAGLGFNVMVKEAPSGYICQETGQKPGIGGWRAQGNIYAYFQGEAGVRIKLGFIRKNVPVIRAGAAILLEAELPNPSWFGARTRIYATVLGVIKININLKFQFGTKCTLVQDPNSDGSVDFDEFKVVTEVTPANNTQNVSLYARPVVTCSTPPNQSFNLPDDNPALPDETYRPQLTSIQFKAGAQVIKATYKLTNGGHNFTIYPDSALSAETNYSLVITINYQKLVSGAWVNVTDNGTALTEVTTTQFRTGKNPPFIADDNIAFMYPYANQKFMYKDESAVGRVLLKYPRADLFAAFNSWKAQYTDMTTNTVAGSTAVTYNSTTHMVSYPVLSGLQNSRSYKVEILGEGNLVPGQTVIDDATRPILSFTFKTSQYNTLAQKINALQVVQHIVGRVQSDVIDLQAEVGNYEGFDLNELVPNVYSGEQPFIYGEAAMDDYYYNYKIEPLIRYNSNFYSGYGITIRRTAEVINLKPNNAIVPSSYYQNAVGGTSYSPIINNRLPFIYDVNRYFNYDFIDLRDQVVNKYLANTQAGPTWAPMYETYRCGFLNLRRCTRLHPAWVAYFNSPAYLASSNSNGISNIPWDMRSLVTEPFPFMTQGTYKVNFRVKLAVSKNGPDQLNYENTPSTQFTYNNPIQ